MIYVYILTDLSGIQYQVEFFTLSMNTLICLCLHNAGEATVQVTLIDKKTVHYNDYSVT